MLEGMRRGILVALLLAGMGASFAGAQTTLAGSVFGSFRSSTKIGSASGNSTSENPSNAAGVLLELRHIANPLMGYEVTYSWRRANEAYSGTVDSPCYPSNPDGGCVVTTTTAAIPANAHQITGDWVVSLKFGNLRPFALAGGGLLFDVPAEGNATASSTACYLTLCSRTTSSISTRTQTRGLFDYGAGLDWTVLPHLGLRFQYRGDVSKAADLASRFTSTDKFTQNAEPMAGVFFRF